MSGYVLFQMWEPFRQMLIERHQLYGDQARIRLLSQFNDIELEADNAAAEWLKRASYRFDPDRHDEGSIHEAANDEGIAFYQLLECATMFDLVWLLGCSMNWTNSYATGLCVKFIIGTGAMKCVPRFGCKILVD